MLVVALGQRGVLCSNIKIIFILKWTKIVKPVKNKEKCMKRAIKL